MKDEKNDDWNGWVEFFKKNTIQEQIKENLNEISFEESNIPTDQCVHLSLNMTNYYSAHWPGWSEYLSGASRKRDE